MLVRVESEHGAESVEAAEVLDLLVEALWRGGKAAGSEAQQFAERAVATKQKLLGDRHPGLAKSLDKLGVLLFVSGRYAEARPPLTRAVAILETAGDSYQTELANTLSHLAPLLQSSGNYSSARPLYERALAIHEKLLGREHMNVGKTLNNLATLLKDMGDYSAAQPLYERALAIVERELGPEHPLVGIGKSNLGELLHRLGDPVAARTLYERAIQIKEKSLGDQHPGLAITLNNLGELLYETGAYERARPLYERALAIQQKALGSDHPEIAFSLSNLARLAFHSGDAGSARAYYERALAIREDSLGPEHPLVADVLVRIATLYHATGDRESALEATLRAERVSREHLRLSARALPERQALSYAAARVSGLDLALSQPAETLVGLDIERIWDALIRSRAVVLDEMVARHRALRTPAGSALASLLDQYQVAIERLANLTVRGPRGASPEAYRKLLRQVRDESEQAEKLLAESSAPFRSQLAAHRVGLDEVLAALPARSALIAYARHGLYPQALAPGGEMVSEPFYSALLFTAGMEHPAIVALGTAREIEDLVRRWREEVIQGLSFPGRAPAAAEAAVRALGGELRDKIWRPLMRQLSSVERVFVVPDGALHLVNFSALPSTNESYLVENGPQPHYLSAERDLVVLAQRTKKRGAPKLLALGGPDYDDVTRFAALRGADERPLAIFLQPVARVVSSLNPFRGGSSPCATFRSLTFENLPAAKSEVEEIAQLWRRTLGKASAIQLTGAGATEGAFKKLAVGRTVLHLATHGFFFSGLCEPAANRRENPLLLSGLALAGANHRKEAAADEEDGILTAEEIGALDLATVDWAVLSGCDTGVGEVRAGEGVFGLRRAFRLAGVGTLIMSLWPVEDRAAGQWMEALYDGRLVQGLGTADAVRAAHLAVLHRRRDAGESTHPFYWAAFVAAGDWR